MQGPASASGYLGKEKKDLCLPAVVTVESTHLLFFFLLLLLYIAFANNLLCIKHRVFFVNNSFLSIMGRRFYIYLSPYCIPHCRLEVARTVRLLFPEGGILRPAGELTEKKKESVSTQKKAASPAGDRMCLFIRPWSVSFRFVSIIGIFSGESDSCGLGGEHISELSMLSMFRSLDGFETGPQYFPRCRLSPLWGRDPIRYST
jgi:hypothetical protein